MHHSLARVKSILCISGLCFFLATGQPPPSDPVGDFFRRLGNSIAHPGQHPTPKPHAEKSKTNTGSAATTTATVTPSPTATPDAEMVRRASLVTEGANLKRDLPYGIPVANKPGFVTSPFSPTQGVVDVRGIPSGTQVKDPFTVKAFLTP